jgi:hypothetical protein
MFYLVMTYVARFLVIVLALPMLGTLIAIATDLLVGLINWRRTFKPRLFWRSKGWRAGYCVGMNFHNSRNPYLGQLYPQEPTERSKSPSGTPTNRKQSFSAGLRPRRVPSTSSKPKKRGRFMQELTNVGGSSFLR